MLQDVVIGRPGPVLREIQLWGATIDADDPLRMSRSDIALQVGISSDVQAVICTEGVLFIRAVESAPCIDDVDLRRSVTGKLLITTTVMLARLAPYVRIGEGVVRAYRPSSALDLFASDVRSSERA